MIRINLLPQEDAQRVAGKRQEMAVGGLVVVAAVGLLVLAHIWQEGRVGATRSTLASVDKKLEAIQGPFSEISKIEQQKQELREKLQVIGELESRTAGPVRMLADLSTATPDRLWLTELQQTGPQVKVTGFGVDEQTVAEFLQRLAQSPYFKGVDLQETSQDEESGGKQKKFVIAGTVTYLTPGAQGASAPGQPAGAAPVPASARTKR